MLPKLFSPFSVWINCSCDPKTFANSSASNFKSFSRSLEQIFLTFGQNNFGNKIPLCRVRRCNKNSQKNKQKWKNQQCVIMGKINVARLKRWCYRVAPRGAHSCAPASWPARRGVTAVSRPGRLHCGRLSWVAAKKCVKHLTLAWRHPGVAAKKIGLIS